MDVWPLNLTAPSLWLYLVEKGAETLRYNFCSSLEQSWQGGSAWLQAANGPSHTCICLRTPAPAEATRAPH